MILVAGCKNSHGIESRNNKTGDHTLTHAKKETQTNAPTHRPPPLRYHATMSRRIAHLDMDAFYASVELLRYPQLEGLAVVVGGTDRSGYDKTTAVRDFARQRDYAGRGVATTASYEARSLGVHSAMGLMKAAALAPDAVLLPADFAEYRRQ